ncbi:MAG TPA: hypothetical protein VK469_23790 [Candidatus Kapabacteria bacterium]|nr:hypothetical protein [Candidatus Kapabacteria bacterium]
MFVIKALAAVRGRFSRKEPPVFWRCIIPQEKNYQVSGEVGKDEG